MGWRLAVPLACVLLLAACSQKDPARDAIAAAEDALNAVYEESQRYVPERYAEVKSELDAARQAFDEERYPEAIAAVRDLPAKAEQLAREAAAAKEARVSELNADWARLSGSLPGRLDAIGSRIEELGTMRRLPEGIDMRLLDETRAAHASARSAWDEAGAAFTAGDLEAAVGKARAAEGMAQDLVARLGIQTG